MSFLLTKLRGVYRVLSNAVPLSDVPAINFGAGLTATYNAVAQRIDVALAATIDNLFATALEVDEEALFNQGLHADGPITATDGVSSNEYLLSGDVIETRVQAGAACPTAGDWYTDGDGVLINIVTGTVVVIPLDLPHGARLTSVTARYKGATGHLAFPANAPAAMPYAEVCYYSVASGAQVILDETDASASAAAFQTEHDITVGPMAHIVDREDRRYSLRITAEGGANALIAGKVLYVTATWTRLADSAIGHD